jgi:thiol-disulfide isomerase/thioredoxin
MNLEMLINSALLRFVLALGIILIGIIIFRSINKLILTRAKSRPLGLESTQPGIPILLYFTTPACIPCKTIQRPAIQRLREKFDAPIQVIEIDAAQRPDLASHWGVLSVPTTFIIDGQGLPRLVNHGVATTDKLLKQFTELIETRS